MELGDVLTRKQIETVEIEVDPVYEEVCRSYLQKQGCRLERMRPGWCLVRFPPGTYEEERLGASGLYTHRSYIVLPSRVEMSLYIASPVNATQRTRITMGFPHEIFSS